VIRRIKAYRIVCNPSLCATIRESSFYVAAMVQNYRTAVRATTSSPMDDKVLAEIQNEIETRFMNDPNYQAWVNEFDQEFDASEESEGEEDEDGIRHSDNTRDFWIEHM
jgi:hypothetical protein